MTKREFGKGEIHEAYFGVCPFCRKHDGYLNLERYHWFVCHEHSVRWYWAKDLSTAWKSQGESVWEKNWNLICGYEVVEPYYPPLTTE